MRCALAAIRLRISTWKKGLIRKNVSLSLFWLLVYLFIFCFLCVTGPWERPNSCFLTIPKECLYRWRATWGIQEIKHEIWLLQSMNHFVDRLIGLHCCCWSTEEKKKLNIYILLWHTYFKFCIQSSYVESLTLPTLSGSIKKDTHAILCTFSYKAKLNSLKLK